MSTRANPNSKKAVARLAHLACALDYEKNKYPLLADRQVLELAVSMVHGVATAHDQAGGHGVYAEDEPAARCRLADALEEFMVVETENVELLDGMEIDGEVSDDEAEFLAGSGVVV